MNQQRAPLKLTPPKESPQPSDELAPLHIKPSIELYLGVPGSGKTYLLKERLRRLLDESGATFEVDDDGDVISYEGPAVYVFTPTNEWGKLLDTVPIAKYNPTIEELKDYPFLRFDSPQELFRHAKPDTIVVIEEMLCIPERDHGIIQQASATHRHEGLFLMVSTQRPRCVPRATIALANRIFLFRLSDAEDGKAIKHLLTPEQIRRVPSLKRGQFIELRPGIDTKS